MEWKISVENKNNQRILVRVFPKYNSIGFIGQHKLKNGAWIDFCTERIELETNLDTVIVALEKIMIRLQDKSDKYENVCEIFKNIKMVEFKGED